MARRRRKKNRNNNNNKGSVHPVLRTAYGRGARSLRDTLLSLLPPPPHHSTTSAGCRAADHLLLPDDPPSYSRLLTHAQCAVSSAAPPPPGRYSAPPHLSQKQIVRNTIQLMRCNRTCHNNLLCKNYDVHSCTSLSVELLSTSDWSLLLNRIGDKLMEYLLRHCSIFVPNGKNIKGLIQLTGIPLTSIDMTKTSHALSEQPHVSAPPQSGCTPTVSNKFQTVAQPNLRTHLKRKRDEATQDVSSWSCSCKLHRRNRLYSWQRRKQHMLNNQNKASSQHVKGKVCTACFCCFMLHTVHNLPADLLIKRQYIFYNRWSSSALLPKKHILNLLKANDCGALSLIKKIFGKSNGNFLHCAHCGHHDRSRSKCMYHSTLSLFKSLIRDAQRCRSRMLLRKHCHVEKQSLPNAKMHQNKNKKIASTFSPIPFSKHQDVVSFVFASLRRIVPLPLLGNQKSWRVLTRNINKFVQLRRHEKFFLGDCLQGLEVSDFEFFSNLEKSCSCETGGRQIMLIKKLFSTWIYWLFFHIVMPIISSNFYVTEKESSRYEVFYYKKPIWGCAVKGFIEKMKMQSFCPVDSDCVRNIFNDSRCLGFSRVRFLPKENCLRPLASLNKPSRLPFLNKGYKSVNSVLSELHVILKTIKVQNPNLIGSSVFDYNDVYQRIHGFISKLKVSAVSMPEVFIVVADVSKAFDSIDQEKLLQIMEGIIKDDEYIVGNYGNVQSRNSSVYPVRKILSLGSISWHGEGADASDTLVQFSSSSGVFVAQAVHKKRRKCDLHRLLTEHVKHNIVKIGHNLFEQKVGITQGSIVSSLLCSFYLGHLEETLIKPYLEKLEEAGNKKTQGNLLMRYLDDFIFVSTSKKQAIGFLERLRRGFRDYNCYMNCEKFRLNFEIEGKNFTNTRYVGDDGIPFLPWSGLLVNCITLEIQADYTRYWDIDIRSTITVHKSNNPGDLLQRKLFMYLLPKSCVILYDSNINSPATVRLNVYQAFLLCAMKFHCYICEMHLSVPNPNRLLKMIRRTCRYMYNLICKRVRDAAICFSIRAVLNLKAREVNWLGLYAFHRILRKKQSRYKDLLLPLTENIDKYDICARMSDDVQYAVDDSHSSMFWKINY